MLSTDADADTCDCDSVLLLYGSNASTTDEATSRTGPYWPAEIFDWDGDDCSDVLVEFGGSGGSVSRAESKP